MPHRWTELEPIAGVARAHRERLIRAGRDPADADRIALGQWRAHGGHAYRVAGCPYCAAIKTAPTGYRVTARVGRVEELPPDEDRYSWWKE